MWPTTCIARRWPAAIVLMLAALMDLVDGTIVNVALPVVRADLHASGTDVEWFVSAYLLAFAATLITAGRAGRHGRALPGPAAHRGAGP